LGLGLSSLLGWLQPKRFLRRQQSYIAIAVAIYAAMWAADRPVPISGTLIYTLPLCNLIALVQDHLGFLYRRERALHSWSIYITLVFTISIVGVAVVNVIQFPIQRLPQQSLWQFLASGWKFPFMATMIVGISTQLYRRARERLESRNRELQRTVEVEAAERKLHGEELNQAREIQQSLLPKEIPCVAGFEIDCAWEPARIVGGDYFDVIRLGDSKLGVCIADVVGKGVSAALLMANVQASVRAFASESITAADLCKRVNSVLCSSVASGKYVTFFYGVLDAEQRIFRYCNAGHPLPILLRAGSKALRLENEGAVLGVFPQWRYETSCQPLEYGDRLLLYTDGITEAENRATEEFGEERLIASALACAGESASTVKSRLIGDVKQFCDFRLRDDATLIVISAKEANSASEIVEDEMCLLSSNLNE
jgi:phosphoserine phosphatase RsbU/P